MTWPVFSVVGRWLAKGQTTVAINPMDANADFSIEKLPGVNSLKWHPGAPALRRLILHVTEQKTNQGCRLIGWHPQHCGNYGVYRITGSHWIPGNGCTSPQRGEAGHHRRPLALL